MEIDGKTGRETELRQLAYEIQINHTAFVN